MTDEPDNVIRFPIERRRLDAFDADQYIEWSAPEPLHWKMDCTDAFHCYLAGETTCSCGEKQRPAS